MIASLVGALKVHQKALDHRSGELVQLDLAQGREDMIDEQLRLSRN